MMKKRIPAILAVCFAISTVVFALLWNTERNSRDDMKEFAQAQAVDACSQFAAYQNGGSISRYWCGVASFYAFQQGYISVFNGTNRSSNYLICNEVYSYLVGEPEISQTYIAELVSIMGLLSKDIEDLSGHAQMLELRNALNARFDKSPLW